MITSAPAWQQTRALLLHERFKALAAAVAGGANLELGWNRISSELHGMSLGDGKTLKASKGMIRENWYKWLRGGRSPKALGLSYSEGKRQVPDALILEWHRRLSAPIGGRNLKGIANIAAIFAKLAMDWKSGIEIPGLGTWQDWWSRKHPALPLPPVPPAFPFDERTMRRHGLNLAMMKAGNVGAAAAKKHMAYVSLDYSTLRKCELYTFDDVRLDLVAFNEATGKVVDVKLYIAMEVASRSVPAFVLRGDDTSLRSEDVDEMVVRALQADGYGIGDGYTTYLLFERGNLACSEACQAKLEGFTDGGIKVLRTSMNEGIRWAGAPADRASGNWMGKAVIEAFMRTLHSLLQHLPGQRGNSRENQPANLGVELPEMADPVSSVRNDATARAEKLAALRLAAMHAGQDARVKLDFLTITQLRAEIVKALDRYHNEPGREFQGHGQYLEAEIAPGVWVPLDTPET